MLNIALPKGRLADKTCIALTEKGYNVSPVEKGDRRLVFTDSDNGIRYFLVKPSDVAIYVERGVADIGVVGKTHICGSNVLYFELDDGTSFIVRPSGTEPKIKVYILAQGDSREQCEERIAKYSGYAEALSK